LLLHRPKICFAKVTFFNNFLGGGRAFRYSSPAGGCVSVSRPWAFQPPPANGTHQPPAGEAATPIPAAAGQASLSAVKNGLKREQIEIFCICLMLPAGGKPETAGIEAA